MNSDTTDPDRFSRNFLSSIGAKVTAILMTIGAVSAAIAVIVLVVFHQVSQDMEGLVDSNLPALERSEHVSESAFLISEAAISALAATQANMPEAEAEISHALAELYQAVRSLPGGEVGSLTKDLQAVSTALEGLVSARKSVFVTDAHALEQTIVLHDASVRIRNELNALAHQAYVETGVDEREPIQTPDLSHNPTQSTRAAAKPHVNATGHPVETLKTLLEINSQISKFQLAILEVLIGHTAQDIQLASENLYDSAKSLAAFAETADSALQADMSLIVSLASPDTGLAVDRLKMLEANELATKTALEARNAVDHIVHHAKKLGSASETAIGAKANAVHAAVVQASRNVAIAMVLATIVLIGAMALARRWIQKPLRGVSETTERLAGGDLSPVDGFDGTSDEIRRIAHALKVFRDGLVERADLSERAEAEREAADAERQANLERQTIAIGAIGDGLSGLAQGDLTARIENQMPEGYSKLRSDFNGAAATLMETVSNVLEAVLNIRGGASETNRAAESFAKRVESQAATLEQTAAALDGLTTNAHQAAADARRVEDATSAAKEVTQNGSKVVNDAVVAMSAIEHSSQHISQIVSVIEDIAFQTNLLALNAGVEAARAGETGRGFAVVASEVRALAQRSSTAALEIKTLINDSTEQVETGAVLVNQAGETLQSVLDQVGEISTLVTGITARVADQSAGLQEINSGMGQLDQVTQQNAAIVEEATAASQMLSNDATKLAELVGQFRIDAQEGQPNDNKDSHPIAAE